MRTQLATNVHTVVAGAHRDTVVPQEAPRYAPDYTVVDTTLERIIARVYRRPTKRQLAARLRSL